MSTVESKKRKGGEKNGRYDRSINYSGRADRYF